MSASVFVRLQKHGAGVDHMMLVWRLHLVVPQLRGLLTPAETTNKKYAVSSTTTMRGRKSEREGESKV